MTYFQESQNAQSTEPVATLKKGLAAGVNAGYSLIGLGSVFFVEHLYYQYWWIAAGGLACGILGNSWASSAQLAINKLGPAEDFTTANALQHEAESAIAELSRSLKNDIPASH